MLIFWDILGHQLDPELPRIAQNERGASFKAKSTKPLKTLTGNALLGVAKKQPFLFRNPMLYPAELRGYEKNGADDRELWGGFQAQTGKRMKDEL